MVLTIADFRNYETLYIKIKTDNIDVNDVKIQYNGVSYTPLHLAVILNQSKSVYILHFHCKAKINVKTETNTTPLHDSVLADFEILAYLLENGAYVDSQDITGATPLYYACLEKKYPEAVLLKEYGADLKIKDVNGITPLEIFQNNKWNYIKFYFSTLQNINSFPQTRNWYNRMIETYF